MTEWKNYQIYYGDLDRLITECVYPLLQPLAPKLEKCFFERHYAGGTHLRVRMNGDAALLEAAAAEFMEPVKRFLEAYPGEPSVKYSPELARQMLEMENEEHAPEDLVYRVNEICERPYQRLRHRLASDQAAFLLEDFLQDCMPLVDAILRAPSSKAEELLRLYFLQALFVGGEISRGSVSYKAHWEGFAAGFRSRTAVDRIRSDYDRDREQIRELMLGVKQTLERERHGTDPVLGKWHALLLVYRQRAKEALDRGDQITRQPEDVATVREAKQAVMANMREDSAFLRSLFDDERFMALFQFDHSLLWPRILTNLLYILVAAVGLNMIERMALCYFASRCVEDYCRCDLTVTLQETIRNVVAEHGHRVGTE
jgi:hypothetical protein